MTPLMPRAHFALGCLTATIAMGGTVLTGVVGSASASPDEDSSGHRTVRTHGDASPVARPGPMARVARKAGAAAARPHIPARAGSMPTAARTSRAGRFTNQPPRLSPTQSGQSPTGLVSGVLNAVDPDSPRLTYTVSGAPAHGTAAVAVDGTWTYTPDPPMAQAGGVDSFRVTVSDAASGFAIHGLAGLLNLFSFGRFGSRGNSSTATVTVSVAPVVVAGQLRPADLAFEGFFRVPTGQLAAGQYSTLAYGGAGLASRVVDGQRHFFLTGHRYANDPLVELVAPANLSDMAATAPVATLYRYWGDIYGGRKVTAEEPDPSQANANWTEGLLWDEANQRVLWSYGNWYAARAVNNPVLGATRLGDDGSITVQGTWRTTSESQQTRSFAVFLSPTVSAATGGATLGLGGKLQSINATASWGPSLHVISSATGDPGAPISARALVSHPISPTTGRTPRTDDYRVARNPDGTVDSAGTEPPVDGVGFWTELDETTGAVFVHTGTGSRSALVYAGGQAAGLIWYGPDLEHGVADGRGYNGSGNHSESYRPMLWFVAEEDLVASAERLLTPDQVNPYTAVDLISEFPELGFLQGRSAGQPVFAEDEGRLYVPFIGGVTEGREPYPLIAVFSVGE